MHWFPWGKISISLAIQALYSIFYIYSGGKCRAKLKGLDSHFTFIMEFLDTHTWTSVLSTLCLSGTHSPDVLLLVLTDIHYRYIYILRVPCRVAFVAFAHRIDVHAQIQPKVLRISLKSIYEMRKGIRNLERERRRQTERVARFFQRRFVKVSFYGRHV